MKSKAIVNTLIFVSGLLVKLQELDPPETQAFAEETEITYGEVTKIVPPDIRTREIQLEIEEPIVITVPITSRGITLLQ